MTAFRLLCADAAGFPLTPRALKKIEAALVKHIKNLKGEAGVAVVDKKTMLDLNTTFRGKKKTTNVLSFPQFTADDLARLLKRKTAQPLYLGDIALHMPTVRQEAKAEKKPLEHHITHLIVHGTLHLLGYDHHNAVVATAMEDMEKAVLAVLNIPDPYKDT